MLYIHVHIHTCMHIHSHVYVHMRMWQVTTSNAPELANLHLAYATRRDANGHREILGAASVALVQRGARDGEFWGATLLLFAVRKGFHRQGVGTILSLIVWPSKGSGLQDCARESTLSCTKPCQEQLPLHSTSSTLPLDDVLFLRLHGKMCAAGKRPLSAHSHLMTLV